MAREPRVLIGAWGLALLVAAGSSCDDKATEVGDAGSTPGGLTPQQASAVLAQVGDTTITLGDFATTLDNMNPFDRLRYQTKKRRRELLQEMIDIELLAQEARRRGLDQLPAVKEAVRQILRKTILAHARQGLPAPAEIPQAQIAAYYREHVHEFREPERRRVAAIVLDDPKKAAEVLQKALAIKQGKEWGELYHQSSVDAPKEIDPHAPLDLAGDRGIVGPPEARGPRGAPEGLGSAEVPVEVQRAVFTVAKVGDVYGKVVVAGDRHYVVRLSGMSQGHTRSLAEADRAIRVAILQQMIDDREKALEKRLRAKLEVKIDEAALKSVDVPKALAGYQPILTPDGGAAPIGAGPKNAKEDDAKKAGPTESATSTGKQDAP